MEFQSSKIAAAFFVFFLLATGGGAAGGCSVGESSTFRGNCEIDGGGCVESCRGEGYTDGYCFTEVANPGYHICTCTRGCYSPAQSTRKMMARN
uniref:Knottin scorpion toxin-like domain-containing protein n=1 Tax=Oryza barthii TaxID=65489 RepID=A0A0D3F1B2_9ORYZ